MKTIPQIIREMRDMNEEQWTSHAPHIERWADDLEAAERELRQLPLHILERWRDAYAGGADDLAAAGDAGSAGHARSSANALAAVLREMQWAR